MVFLEHMLTFLKTTFFTKNLLFIAAGIIGVGFVIAWHELGHFLFCKLFKIKTPSFSIGMGPQLLSAKIGNTQFSLSAIPIGGYVEIANAPQETDTHDHNDHEHYFEQKPYWQKMLVMSGGIMFNVIFAYIVFIALYFFGMPNTQLAYPENAKPIVSSLIPDGPAQPFMQLGDRIVAINGTPLNDSVLVLFDLIKPLAHQTAHITVERKGALVELDIPVGEKKIGDETFGFLGIGFETGPMEGLPLITAIQRGISRVNHFFLQTVLIFKWMFTKRSIEGLGGPIMIFSQTIKHAERGIKIFFAFLAIISINLAVLNLIPLPILDGGQALFATIEAIIRRPLPIRIREYLALLTWALFILLTLYLSFKDISFLRKLKTEDTSQQESKK